MTQSFKNEKPIIHLYTILWNEEKMLPFFFKHYDHFVDKYIFFDDGSDDKTKDLISNHPNTEFREFPLSNLSSYIISAQNVHNQCWKESKNKADWVIITAIDEFLYHKDLIKYLKWCENNNISALPALGYQMISETFPKAKNNLIHEIRDGAPWARMNKLSLFKPDCISETNYQSGRHKAYPIGNIKYPLNDELLNLHFKYLSFNYLFERHKLLKQKLRKTDVKNKWGHQYSFERHKLIDKWNEFEKLKIKDVVDIPVETNNQNFIISERWWRDPQAKKPNSFITLCKLFWINRNM